MRTPNETQLGHIQVGASPREASAPDAGPERITVTAGLSERELLGVGGLLSLRVRAYSAFIKW